MSSPLQDLTIVTIESWMATPSASAIFADMGARVIKIEPLTGDPMRGMSRKPKVDGSIVDFDLQFDVDNRGKESISVALDQPEGQALVARIISQAQVFMCNLLPRRQQKFGLDPATLEAINPTLVHATLTGYGTQGPEAGRPGYDVTAFFGRSGLYDAMREGDSGTVPMARPAQGDHTTGLALVAGILAALRTAERTNSFQTVETSLFETAVWTQATDYSVTAVDRAPVRRRARSQQLTPTANRYPCGDGSWIVMNNPEPSAWPKFCKALGREEWMEDPRFTDPKGRYQNMAALVELIDETLATGSRDEWGARLDANGIIWGPVLALNEVANDAQAEAIGLFPNVDHPEHGTYRTVNIPMRFGRSEVHPRGTSPAIGEHSRSILESVGLEAAEISALVDSGTIGEQG
ncbi:MAG: CaiB/BaiF CoA transferase family protein [Pseudomonadales bacterium]